MPEHHRYIERWLLVGAIVPLVLGLAVHSVWSQRTEEARALYASTTHVATLAQLAAHLAEPTLADGNPSGLAKDLAPIASSKDFLYALAIAPDGNVAAYVGDSERFEQRRLALTDPAESLAIEEGVITATFEIPNGYGQMTVGVDTRAEVKAMHGDVLRDGALSGAVLLIAIGVVWMLMRAIRDRTDRVERAHTMIQKTGRLARVGSWEQTALDVAPVLSPEGIDMLGPELRPALLRQHLSPAQRELLQMTFELGAPLDIEIHAQLPSGDRWIRVHGTAERRHGRTVRVIGALQDVTEQARLREQMRASSQAKSQFLANTSHEMRTPLNGILGMSTLALEAQLTAEVRGYLDAVHLSARNLLGTVNDLLDISRIESGKLTLESVPVDLEQLAVDAVRTLATQANAKDVQLIASVGHELQLKRLADPLRITQIISNLVSNAVKFTPQGEIEVSLARGQSADELIIRVRDTGIGVPAARLEAIFDAFTQSDGTITRQFGGTGLGLTITRELARRMGGDVTVTSAPGIGSTFTVTVTLPFAEPATSDLSSTGRRALVVEPSAAGGRAAALMLERLGYVVSTSSSIAHALSLQASFDAVLLDVSFAHHAGRFENTRVVVMTPFGHSAFGTPLLTVCKPLFSLEVASALQAPVTPIVPVQLAPSPLPQRVVKVLLAEDNAVNAALARRIVEKAGHCVVHVWNGLAALEALDAGTYDLVLMDVQMPELDGIEATRRIRAIERKRGGHQPIVAMTANAMKADEDACREAGMDGFLPKPIDVAKLRALLRSFAEQSFKRAG